ncbi:maintenance of telomere capping protein 5 [Naviculisporaceae sp. PSN 640]
MPSTFERLSDPPKKGKSIKSAYDSESFDADGTIHVDGLVGSATISPSGRDVALASPDGLAIIDLDSPWSPPRRLSSHGLPWLVVDVQWSPFAARDYWVASTANHRCLVWNLNLRDDSSSGAIEHSLQAHSRAITDINFSAHHPDLLATCAVDGYVHCWDLRRPRQPALTFCDWFAGATQVKYSRQDPHIIASSHDRWLHIWDDRKTAEPLRTISAHTSKIYGVDWNRTKATCIVTCSLDKSIKFWDYSKSDETPERVIRTDFPVWRARHTPFGRGLLAMPQNEPGDLYLYDRREEADAPTDCATDPVAVFQGHGNHKVKEFLWRSRGGVDSDGLDNREFQLVSWGEDNELRLQRVDPKYLEGVGYMRGAPVRKNLNITRKGAIYKTFRTVDDTVHHDRRSPTMSDPRPGSGGQYRRSALSVGLRSRLPRVGPTWRGTSMKAKTGSSRNLDKGQLQIGWMKGINMTKRKSGTDLPGGGPHDTSIYSPGFDDGWADPESIQDEFLRISNQLPNVKWESIDMDSLILKASLKGPWGVKGQTIFFKVKVDIPTSYPHTKAPKFYVEKSSFMPEETHKKIESELHQLANEFLQRKKNCLDVAFTYLLGEVDLENSTTFFKNVRDLDDDLDGLADESSSEEDESDMPAGGSASMSQELTASTELDPTTTLAPTQRPAAPPLPRFCGARFTNDGRLVCFFPTKEEKARAFFAVSNPDTLRERPKGEPTFAGFGRLARDSPPPKHRYHDETSATDDQSGDSDGSEESSSSDDSEPTTMDKISLWYHPGRHFRKTWSADESLRSSRGEPGGGTGTGSGTGTGTGASRRRPGRPKNIVSIHDLRNELPSKKQFAQEYAIFGDGADVCNHNAMVAEKYGYPDLVQVWKYAALLLRRDVPLELHRPHYRNESVLVIARDAVARAEEDTDFCGRVKWGYHPLARELIADLLEYFDKVADIQMLAMLTCIFGDSSAEDGVAYAESHLPQPQTPLPMKAPSFSLEYFPTDPELWNINYRSQASSAITTPRTSHTPVMYSDSQGSEDYYGFIEPASNSYSCGETPPKPHHLREADHTQSLSTSPNTRFFQRSNSAMAAASAAFASLPQRLTGGVVSIAGSPPEPPPKKRLSPAETILSNFAPSAITWGASTIFGAASETTPGTARTSLSDDEYRKDELLSMVPVAVSCVPENQGLFDDDGWMPTSLLDPSRNALYANYRYAYAEMLHMWGQPLSRLEIMKFNVLREDSNNVDHYNSFSSGGGADDTAGYASADRDSGATSHATVTGATSPTVPFGGRREQLQSLLASGRGLDVTGLCRVHEIQLEPVEYSRPTHGLLGGAVGICERCQPHNKIPQMQLRCVYCCEPIDALYPPCLGCGCAFHESCLAEWHDMGEVECPAGDECHCVEEANNGQVESWPALRAAVERAEMARMKAFMERTGATKRLSSAKASLASSSRPRRRSVPTDLSKFVGIGDTEDDDDDGADGSTLVGDDESDRRSVIGLVTSATTRRGTARNRSYEGKQQQQQEEDEYDHINRQDWETGDTSAGSASSTGTGSYSRHGHTGTGTATATSSQQRGKGGGGGSGNNNNSLKPAPWEGDEPISAARLSLGNRLKKSLGESGRPSVLRRQSGGVSVWKSGGAQPQKGGGGGGAGGSGGAGSSGSHNGAGSGV